MTAFLEKLQTAGLSSLGAREISILQVNLGYRCNMACKHCHAEAGPARTEEMDDVTARHVLRILGEGAIRTLDLTGGAPELNPHFRRILRESASMGIRTVVRSNLTVLFEEGMTDLPEMFAATGAEVVASVPYYTEDTVDRVRGKGTFCRSLQALKLLNSLGYGMDSSGLVLNLVYNPPGAYLAPPQKNLEEEYRKILAERHGIHFNNLYTFTNMPIGRFRHFLVRSGNLGRYQSSLVNAFNAGTLDGLMCRHLVSVSWNGSLHDCDFNQILGIPLAKDCPQRIEEFDYSRLSERKIVVGDHCFGCTAGQGST